jgi:hypothetical protein
LLAYGPTGIYGSLSRKTSRRRIISTATERRAKEIFFNGSFEKSPKSNEFLVTDEKSWLSHGFMQYNLQK